MMTLLAWAPTALLFTLASASLRQIGLRHQIVYMFSAPPPYSEAQRSCRRGRALWAARRFAVRSFRISLASSAVIVSLSSGRAQLVSR